MRKIGRGRRTGPGGLGPWTLLLAAGLLILAGAEPAAAREALPASPGDHALVRALAAGEDPDRWEELSPGEKRRLKQRYREYRSMPPEERRVLRDRMDRLNRMPESDRRLYQRRFRQWQRLEPAERRRILDNFQRWETLSPEERERIRRRFRD